MVNAIPKDLVLKLNQELKAPYFIETGSYKGNTASWASENFREVGTIELNKERFDKIKRKGDYKNVHWFQGDSGKWLPAILSSDIQEPIFFWLDAHGLLNDETTYPDSECPLIAELNAILKWQDKHNQECVILIDDARLFTQELPLPYHPERWPNFYTIVTLLENFYIDIINDVIVCVPQRMKDLLNEQK